MSSSAELDWSVFAVRDVADGVEIRSPAAEVAALLQRYRSDVDALEGKVADARTDALRVLAEQAVLAVQLESALALYEAALVEASLPKVHHHLRIIKDRMIEALEGAGLEILRLVGQPYDEVEGLVEVDGWLHREELETEVVLEANEPAIGSNGTILRLGRVVMGAPKRNAPGTDDGEGPQAET